MYRNIVFLASAKKRNFSMGNNELFLEVRFYMSKNNIASTLAHGEDSEVAIF